MLSRSVRLAFGTAVFTLLTCLGTMTALHAGILFSGGDGEGGAEYAAFAQKVATPGGALIEFFSGGPTLYEPQAVRLGPDGNFYVLEAENSAEVGALPLVYRYGSNGNYLGVFIARGIYSAGGATVDLSAANELDPADLVFGPDGNIYMSVYEMDSALPPNPSYGSNGMVLRFSGSTGAFMGIFVANGAGDGGANRISEPRSLTFDPAGNLYVGNSNSVLKFNSSGAFVSVVVDDADPLVDEISGLTFHNGALYAANEDGDNILKVTFNPNGSTNAVSVFVAAGSGGLEEPKGLVFGQDGLLYVASSGNQAALRFDGTTGAFRDAFVPGHASDEPPNYDPYGVLVFTVPETEVPVMNPPLIAALSLSLLVMGGLAYRRFGRRRG